jgi:hypothetical protein
MRTQTLLALFGAIALSASVSAYAGPTVTPNAGNPAAMDIQLIPAPYKLRPVQFEGVQGTYGLDDGRTMRITSEKRKLYAQINGGDKEEIVAVAQNVFLTADQDLRLEFDQIPFATEVRLTSLHK